MVSGWRRVQIGILKEKVDELKIISITVYILFVAALFVALGKVV